MTRMAKRAILLFGPESAGNHVVMRALIRAGCEGDAEDVQRWDSLDPSAPLVAWGKSVPSAEQWPDIAGMVKRLRGLGYYVQALVISRNWNATVQSQLRRKRTEDFECVLGNVRSAYMHIFGGLASTDTPYVMCHYDYLVASPNTELRFVCKALGLTVPSAEEVVNMNSKYEVAR